MEQDQDESIVSTRAHWRALWHPLRIGILRLTAQKAMTNQELAAALGVESGHLHHHTKQLLEAGLITLAGTRQRKAIQEKLYRASSARLTALVTDTDGSAPPLINALEAGTRLYQSSWDLDHSIFSLGAHFIVTIAPERALELKSVWQSIINDAQSGKSDAEDSIPVAFTFLAHALPALKGKQEKDLEADR